MQRHWAEPLCRAIEALRTAATPDQYRLGSTNVCRAALELRAESRWPTPIRNRSQLVVSYADMLADTPDDESLRHALLDALDALAAVVSVTTPGD